MMRVVVIGGVAGGMSAAAKLKRNLKDGVDIVVYEKGVEISYGACGIPFYVSGHIKEAGDLLERSVEEFAAGGIDVKIRHEVLSVDTAAKTVSVKNLDSGETFTREYDKLVVGSGARPRKIPPFDVDRSNLLVIRNVADGVQLRKALEDEAVRDVVIVGAGFIGLEIAEGCEKHGKKVSVVELAPRIMSNMDQEITDPMTAELELNGVRVLTSSKVVEFECAGDRIGSVVVEAVDGTRQTLHADLVVNAVGIVPNTEFIDVEKMPNGAILVNDRMETSAADVYAAGDCTAMRSFVTGQPMYAPLGTNANKQGRIIAEVLGGKKVPDFKLIGASAVRLFGLDAAKVGLSEGEAVRLGVPYRAHSITGNSYASYYGKEKVFIKLVYDPESRRVLGAQAVGQGIVVPRANYFSIAIAAGVTVDDFGFMDLCYSPPFSGVWDAALIAANTAK